MAFGTNMKDYSKDRTNLHVDKISKWLNKSYFSPVIVELSPIGGCNQKCRFCYVDQLPHYNKKISADLLNKIFNELVDNDVKAVLLQGTGEPLMNKDLPEAIFQASKKGLEFSLTTNGVLLKPKITEKILNCLTFVKFSVLDSDPSRYAITHVCDEKQWHMLQENLKYVVNYRNENEISTALIGTVYVEPETFDHIPDIVNFYKKIGLDYIVVQEATYTELTPGRNKNVSYRPGKQKFNTTDPNIKRVNINHEYLSEGYNPKKIKLMKDQLFKLNDDNFKVKVRFPINDDSYHVGFSKDNWKKNYCHGINFFPVIAADAKLYPCYRGWGDKKFEIGDFANQSFEQMWSGEKKKKVFKQILSTKPCGDECQVCGVSKLNDRLMAHKENNKWKNFII